MTRSRHQRRSFLARVKELLFGSSEVERPQTRRRLEFEGLERRQLMAADVGTISGHVFRDTSGDGKWQASEVGISQAKVQLWRDNGDGVFSTTTDTLVTTATTNASGAYSFNNLTMADYFLRRPSQTLVGGTNPGIKLSQKISSKIHISALKTVIDNFDTPTSQTAAADTTNDNVPVTSVAGGLLGSNTIGGEREILTNFTGDAEGPGILASARVATINVGGKPSGLLLLDATSSAKGTYTLVYDGTDGNASVNPNLSTGLGNVNLRAGGANHLRINLNSLDLAGAVVRVTVYTDATHFSTGTVTLMPRVVDGTAQSGGIVDYHFNFDGSGDGGFQAGSGAAGGANFSSVKAVVMSIDVPSDVDARLELLGAYGAANETVDLAANEVDVSVDKTVDNAAPVVGTLVNYTLKVSNAQTLANGKTSGQATGVTLDDTLFTSLVASGKLTYVSDTSGGAFNTSTGIWNVGTLNAGQSRSIVVTMRVNFSAMPSVNNTLKLKTVDQLDVDTNDWTDQETITPKNVDIAVSKTVNNAHPDHNDSVVFTVTAKNLGTANAQDVKLTDVFTTLAGYHIDSITTSVGTYNQATGVWTIGALTAGQSVTLIVTGDLIDGECDPFTNTASMASIGGGAVDTNTANNSASVTVTPQEADLGVTKTVSVNPTPSQGNPNVTFKIVVSNTGPDAATGVIIADQLPAGLAFVSASSGSYNATTGKWSIGTIASGESKTLTVTARLKSGVTTAVISNTASVDELDQCDDNQANDSSSVTVSPQVIDLSVTKTVDNTSPKLHGQVMFTITVTNNGPNAATDVSLFDAMSSGLTYVNSAATQGSLDAATHIWTVGTIGVGQTFTLTINATADSTDLQMNTAEVITANQFDIDSTPNNGQGGEDDIASVVVQAQAIDLSVTKAASTSISAVNANVTFTVTVTNSGPNVATGVSLFDAISPGLVYQTSSTTAGVFNPITRIWTIGTIAVGQTVTFTMTAKAMMAGDLMNTVEILTADQTDIDSTPANGRAGEDDIASVVVHVEPPIPQAIPDLTKRRFLSR